MLGPTRAGAGETPLLEIARMFDLISPPCVADASDDTILAHFLPRGLLVYEDAPSAGSWEIVPASVHIPLHTEPLATLDLAKTTILTNETTSVLAPGLSVLLPG